MASNSIFIEAKIEIESCNLWQLANNSLLSSGHGYEKTDKRPPKSSIVLQKDSIYQLNVKPIQYRTIIIGGRHQGHVPPHSD